MLVLLLTALAAATSIAGDLSPKDLVAQLYQAHRSKHDPLDETALLDRYFDPALLQLYLKDKREAILQIAAKRGARNVRVFGSVARGEADDQSDIDFLVDMEPGRSLLDLGGLLMDLQDLLGRNVDVVTERGLKPRIRERVLHEAVAL